MKLNATFLAAGTICAIGLASPLASQGGKDAALEAACRSTEVTAPESCPCTITAARKAGLNDTELASLFQDDGHSQPVDQAKYGRFWQVKSQCIADATMAKMGITPGNPLPGVPANMRPGMPFPPANTPVPPIARPGQSAPPAPVAAAAPAPMPEAGRRTVAEVEAMIAKLRDTAWEYTAPKSEGGEWHRIDFLADGNLMIFQTADSKNAKDRSARVFRMSAEAGKYGASIRTDEVDSGMRDGLPINSVTDTVLIYEKRYVRSGEEVAYRKVGKANPSFPASSPQQLEDGFWRMQFTRGDNNPLFLNRQQLSGYVGEIRSANFLSSSDQLYLAGPKDSQMCESACSLVLNDFDFRSNQVRGRLIDEFGVDYIGIRIEEPDNRGNTAASLRAFDGLGGWKEWRCTRGTTLNCRQTGKQAPPAAATVSTAGLTGRLGPVTGAIYGEAQCSNDYYLAPADRSVLRSADTLERYIRTNGASRIATLVDVRGSDMPGLKLKIDGRERVLSSTGAGEDSWAAGNVRFVFRKTGEPIYDNPAYGFIPGTATLTIDGQTQTIDLIENGAC